MGRDAPGVRLHVHGERAELMVSDDVDLASEPAMEQLIGQAVDRGAIHLVLSFCGASFVGGPAVRLALYALDSVRGRGSVKIRGDRHVQRLFEITGVAPRITFEIC